MRRSGFTIVEFIITISAMLIVMAAVFPVVFNKVQTSNTVHKDETLTFCCNDASKCLSSDQKIKYQLSGSPSINEWTFKIKEYHEFATVKLTGGGAGGGTYVGGGAGSSEEITFPALKGTYKVVLGSGGSAKNNGSPTSLFQQLDDGKWVMLATVQGGIASDKETKNDTGLSEDGQASSYSETCGRGGDKGQSGTAGEVIISW